ncbi:MAG: group 1 glycosyl transferase [Parcubacteria group bacterium Gr01-1014_2]|nr:MAG: group 1 glycosyl transferase [Parcubacteria group bacterium Gr01-1014_2]
MAALDEMFPEAPIFTLIYDQEATNSTFKDKKIHTSFLQKIPGSKKYFRQLIWLMPLAIEQFNLSDFDFVISVSHSFGKGIITKPSTKHICYCLTPTRYLWHDAGLPFRPISKFLLTYLRTWDYQAAQRPDYFIACSENVKQRIKKYYGRESQVVYPPVETEKFNKSDQYLYHDREKNTNLSDGPDDYFLMVGRLVPYKRFDIAIEAFAKMPDEKLLIIGNGPEYKRFQVLSFKLQAKNIKFLGQVSDSELPKYYAGCKALIFPQEEDFGIVPLEAMASGRPVIAYRSGGALETIKEGETGLFFNSQTAESLANVVKTFDYKKFDPEKIKRSVKSFDERVFKDKIFEFVSELT